MNPNSKSHSECDRVLSPNRDLLVLGKPYYKPVLLRKQAQYYPTHGIAIDKEINMSRTVLSGPVVRGRIRAQLFLYAKQKAVSGSKLSYQFACNARIACSGLLLSILLGNL